MGKKQQEVKNPFVCAVGGNTFIIRFFEDHELHIFTSKEDPKTNWTERCPVGTSK